MPSTPANKAARNAYRRANGLCITCGQLRPVLKSPRDPAKRRVASSAENRAVLKQKIAALHPDTNGGRSPDPEELLLAVEKLHRTKPGTTIRVQAGFRVFARSNWWTVKKYLSGGWYECVRSVPKPGSPMAPILKHDNIQLQEMRDARCGPNYKWRMVSVGDYMRGGIVWK